ncbi:hypothetical protein ACUODJ_43330, partial [Escherichia sp. HC-CC]
FSGHKTESQVLVYDRKTKISPTLNKNALIHYLIPIHFKNIGNPGGT